MKLFTPVINRDVADIYHIWYWWQTCVSYIYSDWQHEELYSLVRIWELATGIPATVEEGARLQFFKVVKQTGLIVNADLTLNQLDINQTAERLPSLQQTLDIAIRDFAIHHPHWKPPHRLGRSQQRIRAAMEVIEDSETWWEMTRVSSDQEIENLWNENLAATRELIESRRFQYSAISLDWSTRALIQITRFFIPKELFLHNARSTETGRQEAIRFWTAITEQEPRPEELLQFNYLCRLAAQHITIPIDTVIRQSPGASAPKTKMFDTLTAEYTAELQALRVAGRAEWQQILDAASPVPAIETMPDALRALIGSFHSLGVTINEGGGASSSSASSSHKAARR